jgi:hypothetical protein
MNPLAVFRRFGELLDPLLREAEPPCDANFAACTFFYDSRSSRSTVGIDTLLRTSGTPVKRVWRSINISAG